ncbi:MAG TPA: CO dehydrogenase/CO-methylating acetyl-CoA synthase complex subunit beta, partial [Armatimonadetes bacterium]|nr:CO dehydrogenase/CO-methylating acetyl-CoA synthase complex subunit beta [Armatimonadota bacterium]
DPNVYVPAEEPSPDNIWLGAADDIIMRKRGVEFVDGTAPGFAAILGAAPDVDTAVRIARELQEKNLYVFMASEHNGVRMAEQLVEADVQIGWTTRLVPFGPDTSATVFSIGFATRVAMAFGGIKPGEYRRILIYNKERVFAFVLALGFVTDEWYANAAGAINWGFPTIADTPIPQVLPTGICTYEHVVSNVPHDEIVSKAIEVRGLKVTVTKVPVPVSYGPAFEGERVRKADLFVEFGGNRSLAVELCRMRRMDEIQDGRIELIGPDIDQVEEGSALPLAILVEIAGRKMEEDFEPILERQIHHFINYAQGLFHMGQRDIVWLRISKAAYEHGFRLHHIGEILHARFHQDFGNILDKVQITLYTNEEDVRRILEEARQIYHARDARMEGLKDEDVDIFYSCLLCQSFAPTHVCVISPERPGLCGAYTWLDAKAMYEVNPEGPNQPVEYGEIIDELKGAWKGVNEFVRKASRGAIDGYNFYSVVDEGMIEMAARVLGVGRVDVREDGNTM